MKISTILKAFIVVTFLSGSAIAQERQLSEEQIEQLLQRVEETKTRLNLTEEQSELVRPIIRENMMDSLEVLQKHGFEQGHRPELNFRQKIALGKDMRAVREETDGKLSAILSKEQMDEYQVIRDERRKQMRERLGL